jgi:hypothetical protein
MSKGLGDVRNGSYVREESNPLMLVMVGRSRALADAAAGAHDSI